MEDWRDKYSNCHDCAEFQDSRDPTDMCNKCLCFNCQYDRDKCLKSVWCERDKIDINILNKLL